MSFNTSYVVNDIKTLRGKNITKDSVLLNNVAAIGASPVIDVRGMGNATIQIRGSFTAIVQFEGRTSSSGGWVPLQALRRDTGEVSSKTSNPAIYTVPVSGLIELRLNITDFSGTSGVYAEVSVSPETIVLPTTTKNLDKFEWSLPANPSTLLASAPWKQTQPFINVKVLKSQGLIYLELQELGDFGYTPLRTLKKFYANNETIKMDVRGLGRLRLQARAGYRGADGITLEDVKISVWGSEQ